jgi:hypothetical protein
MDLRALEQFMTTSRAISKDKNLNPSELRPATPLPFQAPATISDEKHLSGAETLRANSCAEDGFELIGLENFFEDPVNEQINWEEFFSAKYLHPIFQPQADRPVVFSFSSARRKHIRLRRS